MAESKMPEIIWANGAGVYGDEPNGTSGYIRADIAEAMAEALRAILPFIPKSSASDGGPNARSENVAAADKVRSALSRYRAAVTSGQMTDDRFKLALEQSEYVLTAVEARFPNWRSFRDLIDCIDVTLHQLRSDHGSGTASNSAREPGFIKPDNDRQVFFYEQDFYVLSNFSAFAVKWGPYTLPTSEHLYHWRRFFLAGHGTADRVCDQIMHAPSAHAAFKLAQANKVYQVDRWDDMKVAEMKAILHAKVEQHEYVRRKLLATGERELIEDSWRDDFWGWGPNRNGKNMLGKIWMEVRHEIRLPAEAKAHHG